MSPQNKFCPSCGFQLTNLAAPPASKSQTERKVVAHRPPVERLLILIQMGLGIVLIVLGALLLPTSVFGFAIAFVIFGLTSLAAGYGLWKERSWANSALSLSGIFYLVLGAILVLAAVLTHPPSGWIGGVGALGMILGLFSIVWIRSSKFRSRFGGRP